MRSAAAAFLVADDPLVLLAERNAPLQALPPLWRADRLDSRCAAAGEAQPTGHAALDAELPGGGWPAAGLTELLGRARRRRAALVGTGFR